MKKCLSVLLILAAFRINAQDISARNFKQDFFLTLDNDAFLAQTVDRYYSSGIFFRYRRVIPPNSALTRLGGQKIDKTFYSIGFSHLFFTPSDLKLRTIDQLDRPYAGVISFNFGVNFLRNSHSLISMKLDAGILGPGAGMSGLQEWYHDIIGAKKPRGWQYQIENSPLVTLSFDYLRSLLKTGKFEFFSEGSLAGGTVFNFIKPGLSFRWGKYQPLENSTYVRSRLGSIGHDMEKSKWKESYFFIKAYMSYVPYDATIEGNFLGKKSIHTESAQRLRYHIKYGWNLGLKRWDFGLAFNNVRRETKEAKDHYYITIDVLLRI